MKLPDLAEYLGLACVVLAIALLSSPWWGLLAFGVGLTVEAITHREGTQ